jgi:hypothetical protein
MKKQMRYSDAELSVIKNTFAENEDVLKAIRKHFLQIKLSKAEEAILQGFSKDVFAVLRKSFLPEIDGDAPIHQVVDLLITVDIKEKTPDQLYLAFNARNVLMAYLDERLKEMEGGKSANVFKFADLSVIEGKDEEKLWIDMNVRNTLVVHVEQQLSQLQILAGDKNESPEATKEKLLKDSSK